jgi:CheY-like chemotaxis protein
MSLHAFILTRDREVFTTLLPILQAATLKVEGCFSPGEALAKLQKNKYDAILIDCASVPDAGDVLEALRNGRSNKRAIAFAITEDPDESRRAFKAGANFVIEHPLTAERVTRSLRAAHGLIVRERRRYFRTPLDTPIAVQHGQSSHRWNITDVSEGGLSAVVPMDLSTLPKGQLNISFKMPHSVMPIEGKAEIMWSRTGRVGLRFTTLTPQSRAELDRTMAKRFEDSERLSVRASAR